MKTLLLIALLALGLFSNELYYYKSGKRIYIDSIKVKRDSKFLQFTTNNKAISIPNSFIVKPKDEEALESIQKRAKLVDRAGESYLFEANSSIEAIELANSIYEENLSHFSAPNFIYEKELRGEVSDEYYLTNSWHLDSINQNRVMNLSKGEGIKVAVYDSGIEVEHSELKNNYLYGFNFDSLNYDVSPNSRSGESIDYHGSAVAGIILASDDGVGSVGVAPKSYLISIKNIKSSDFLTVKAFQFAKEENIDIINCSWGTYSVSDAVADAIKDFTLNARDKKGGFVIFAVGNDGAGEEVWGEDESALDSVIAVGSTNRVKLKSNFSNYGSKLDIMAPGGEYIKSDKSQNEGLTTLDLIGNDGFNDLDYILDSDKKIIGTSFSSPIVAGVIANILSINPSLTKDEVVDILYSTTQKVGKEIYITKDSYTFNENYGYGLIDSQSAILKSYKKAFYQNIKSGWNLISNSSSKSLDRNQFQNKTILVYRYGEWILNPDTIEAGEGFWIKSESIEKLYFQDTKYFEELDIDSNWQLLGAMKNLRFDLNRYNIIVYRDGKYISNSEIIYKGEGFWAKLKMK